MYHVTCFQGWSGHNRPGRRIFQWELQTECLGAVNRGESQRGKSENSRKLWRYMTKTFFVVMGIFHVCGTVFFVFVTWTFLFYIHFVFWKKWMCKDALNWSRVREKTFKTLQNISISNKHCSFALYIHQRNREKLNVSSTISSSTTVTLIINRNVDKIIILEWFLKDHVTLKTGVMMLKTHDHRNKWHLTMHSHWNFILCIVK